MDRKKKGMRVMKKFKKITAFFLTAVMILLMGSTVLATETTNLPSEPAEKPADLTGHQYKAYRIFNGNHYKDVKGDLSDVGWGDGIDAEKFLSALKGSGDFGSPNPFAGIEFDENAAYKSADAVAKVIMEWGDYDSRARAFARLAYRYKTGEGRENNENLPAGYYLVVDVTDIEGTEDGVKNLAVLQQVGLHGPVPENKTDIPELEKKVKEINDSDKDIQDSWGDTADYDIGDEVEFVLTGTLPEDYDSYKEEYRYEFHDILSPALSLKQDTIVVKVDGTEIPSTSYEFATASESDGSNHFSIRFENLKTLPNVTVTKDTLITVEYKAELLGGDNVVYGTPGNINRAYLRYSNDPNYNGEGEPSIGQTPEDKVVVFTYQLVVNKKDEDGEELEGAGFSLYKLNKETGEYEAYNPAGNAEGNVTVVETEDEETGTTETYYEIKGVTTFTFKGIDAGSYKLVESTIPEGYNRASDMYFTVAAESNETDGITKLEITEVRDADGTQYTEADGNAVFTFTPNIADGSLSTDIVNLRGLLFPSTGGRGTTIFYIVGGILVVGAGVLLVWKRRAGKGE